MAERAVAQVLEDVAVADERRQPDPVHALGAHRRGRHEQLVGVAVLEVDHPVAADAAAGDRAHGHDGRAVVRASAAERRGAGGQVEQGEERATGARRRRGSRCGGQVGQDRAQHVDQPLGGQLAGAGHEGAPVRVALAAHRGRAAGLVEDGPDLLLDERALLLDDQDLVARVGQRRHRRRDDRRGQGQLEDADADGGEVVGADAARLEGAEHVAVGAPGAHDAEAGAALGAERPVEAPGLDPRLGGPQAAVEPQLLEVGPQDRAAGRVVPRLAVDHERRGPRRRGGRGRCRPRRCRRRPR